MEFCIAQNIVPNTFVLYSQNYLETLLKELGREIKILTKRFKEVPYSGGAVASWLVPIFSGSSGPGSSSYRGHITLAVALSTQVYKWVPASLMMGGGGGGGG